MLSEFLTNKLKALYLKQNTLPKLIEGFNIPTQTIEEYYVDLQMMLDDKVGTNKEPILEKQIFDKIKDKQAAHKVLIIGESGTGKSTLLQKIAYMWGKGEAFQDQFDYVFKVELKLLLSDWKNDYEKREFRKNPLACFIDYVFRKDGLINTEEVFDIFNHVSQDRILFLLDGYDEIESHISSQNKPKIKDIIYECKNIIMTSRPSIINSDIERYFDRLVENRGFSYTSAQKYIEQYFAIQQNMLIQELKKFSSPGSEISGAPNLLEYLRSSDDLKYELFLQLTERIGIPKDSLLEHSIDQINKSIIDYYTSINSLLINLLELNQNLRELITIPINAAMLCIICSDKSTIAKLNQDFNIGNLYSEFFFWLGERYEKKIFLNNIISSEDISKTLVLQKLEEIAYNTFKDNIKISKTLLKTVTNHNIGKLRNIVKFGLLNVTKHIDTISDDQLYRHEYDFIHTSFQEYLTALYFKDQLSSSNDKESSRMAEFIAEHRNEPRYLNILKFTTGLITQQATNKIVVIKFWEAVICNVDIVIELNVNNKVTLLMHLLSQAKINNKTDDRIPHLEKVQTLIDVVIATDVIGFHEQLIASSYTSSKITEAILAILGLNFKWCIEYADTIIKEQQEFRQIAINYLKNIVSSQNQEEKLIDLSKEILINNNIPFVLEDAHYKKEKPTISHIFQLQIAITLLSNLIKKSNVSYSDFMNKILIILHYPNWQIKLVAINTLEQFIKNKSKLLDLNLAIKTINKVQYDIIEDNLREEIFNLISAIQEVILEPQKIMFQLYSNKIFFDQFEILHDLGLTKEVMADINNTLPYIPNIELMNQEIVDNLIDQTKNLNWIQQYIAIKLLNQIAKQKPELVDIRMYDALIQKLYKDDYTWASTSAYIQNAAAQAIGAIAIDKAELINIDSIISKLNQDKNYVGDKDDYPSISAAQAIKEIALSRPNLINSNIVEILISKLNHVTYSMPLTTSAYIDAIGAIALNRIELLNNSSICEVMISLISKDFVYFNEMVKLKIAKATGILSDNRHELINCDVINILISNIKDSFLYIFHYGASNEDITTIVSIASKANLIDCHIVSMLTEKISNGDYDTMNIAIIALENITYNHPELINLNTIYIVTNKFLKTEKIMHNKLSNNIYYGLLISQVNEIFNSLESVHTETDILFTTMITILNDSYNVSRRQQINQNNFVTLTLPELISFNKDNALSNKLSIFSVFPKIISLIKSVDAYDYAQSKNLSSFKLFNDELTKFNKVRNFHDEPTNNIIVKLIVAITFTRPDLIECYIFDSLISQLDFNNQYIVNILTTELKHSYHYNDDYVYAISKVISKIVKIKPELININLLTNSLKIDYYTDENRMETIKAIGIIASEKPELVDIDILLNKLSEAKNSAPFSRSARLEIVKAVSTIALNQPKLINIDILINDLNDYCYEIKLEALRAIGEIISRKADFINIDVLLNKLNDDYDSVKLETARTIGKIVSRRPELISMDILLNKLNDDNYNIRLGIARTIGEIASMRPELINMDILISKLNDISDDNFRSGAAQAISEIVSKKPDLISMSTLINQLNDNKFHVRFGAISAISAIISNQPKLINSDIINILITELSHELIISADELERLDSNKVEFLIKQLDAWILVLLEAVSTVVLNKPKLINIDMIEVIINKFYYNHDVKSAAIKTISIISSNIPELINNNTAYDLINSLNSIYYYNIPESAKIFARIAAVQLKLINIDVLMNRLSDSDYYVRLSAINEIGEIAPNIPELITNNTLNRLIKLLDEDYNKEVVIEHSNQLAYAVGRPDIVDIFINGGNNDIIFAVIRAICVIVSKMPKLASSDVINILINNLNLGSNECRQMIVKAISIIICNTPKLINLETMISRLNDSDNTHLVAMLEIISEIISNKIELINHNTINLLYNKLNYNDNQRFLAANIINRIASVKAILIDIHLLMDKLSEDVSSICFEAITKIIYNHSDLINTSIIIKKLNSEFEENRLRAIEVFRIITFNQIELVNDDIVYSLTSKLDDYKPKVKFRAAETLNLIISKKFELVNSNLLDILINKLSQDKYSAYSTSFVASTILLKIISNSSPDVITKLLNHNSQEARELTIRFLISILTCLETLVSVKINVILSIISFYDHNDKEKKDLIEKAKNVLYSKLNHITLEDIILINVEYDYLLKLSQETTTFFQKLLHKILANNIVSEIERDFIIKSIEHDIMDISIKLDEQVIISEGKIYRLSSKVHFEEIKTAALKQTDNILVQQDITHRPLFVNSGIGLKIASYDIEKVDVQLIARLDQAQEDARNFFKNIAGPEAKYYKQDNIIITNSILDAAFRENIANPDLNDKMYYLADIVFDKEENSTRLSDYYCDLVSMLAEDPSKFEIKRWIYNNDDTKKNDPIQNTMISMTEIMNQNSVDELFTNASIVLLSLAQKVKIIEDANSTCSKARKADAPSKPYNMKIDILAEKYRPKLDYDFDHMKEMLRDIKTINKSEATKACYANEQFSIKIKLKNYLKVEKEVFSTDINYDLDIGCVSYTKVEKIPITYNWLDKRIFTFVHENQEVQNPLEFCRIPTSFILACGKNVHFKEKSVTKDEFIIQNKEIPENVISTIIKAINNIEERFSALHNGQAIDECKILGFEYQDLCVY